MPRDRDEPGYAGWFEGLKEDQEDRSDRGAGQLHRRAQQALSLPAPLQLVVPKAPKMKLKCKRSKFLECRAGIKLQRHRAAYPSSG